MRANRFLQTKYVEIKYRKKQLTAERVLKNYFFDVDIFQRKK